MSPLIPDDKHQYVLKYGVDVPEEKPAFPLPLQHVGIAGKTVWVGLVDNNSGHLPFTARILVALPGGRRGIHMSRIEEEIDESVFILDRVEQQNRKYKLKVIENFLKEGYDLLSIYSLCCDHIISKRVNKDEELL